MRFAGEVLEQMAADRRDPGQRHYDETNRNKKPGISIPLKAIKYDRDATDPAIIFDEQGVPTLIENMKKEFILNDPSSGVG